MQAISQNEIIALMSDINSFTDNAESMISSAQNSYNLKKFL